MCAANLPLVNFCHRAHLSIEEMATQALSVNFVNHPPHEPPRYDMHTLHASRFGGTAGHLHSNPSPRSSRPFSALPPRKNSSHRIRPHEATSAFSNLAWEPQQDRAVARMLKALDIHAVEIVPTRYWKTPTMATARDLAAVRTRWTRAGFQIVSLQSLLFGRDDLQLFASAASRGYMRDYLKRIFNVAASLGASSLVFGSPKNRSIGAHSRLAARRIAVDFFRAVGDDALRAGVVLGLEANPPEYGTDFLNSGAQLLRFLGYVKHPAIRWHVDSGALILAHEQPSALIKRGAPLIPVGPCERALPPPTRPQRPRAAQTRRGPSPPALYRPCVRPDAPPQAPVPRVSRPSPKPPSC